MNEMHSGGGSVNIGNADYEEFPQIAKDMRNIGEELNQSIVKVYKTLSNLRLNWYGIYYDRTVKAFSEPDLLEMINKSVEIAYKTFPDLLVRAANNYSGFDRDAAVGTEGNPNVIKVVPIEVTNERRLRFVEAEVSNAQIEIEKEFNEAIGYMEAIKNAFDRVQWESGAATIFKELFLNNKIEITRKFEDLKTCMTDNIKQAREAAGVTESNNTLTE